MNFPPYLLASNIKPRTRWLLVSISWLAYIVLYLALYAWLGESLVGIGMLPALLTAWLFGLNGAVFGVLFHYAISISMSMLVGLSPWELIAHRWPGAIGVAVIAVLQGWLSNLFCQIEKERLILQNTRAELDRTQVEQATQRYQAHLASIIQYSENAIISQTLDGTITSWNSGATKLYGYTATEMIGHRFSEVMPKEQVSEALALRERVARGETISHYETRRRRKDGMWIEVAMSISPIRDTTGELSGISLIVQDVTERKKLEGQLRTQNTFFTTLHQITLGLINQLKVDELLHTLITETGKMFGTQYGYIELFAPDETYAITRAVWGELEDVGYRRPVETGLGGIVRRTGKPTVLADYSTWEGRVPETLYDSLHAVATVPLRNAQKVIGILGLGYTIPHITFSETQLEMLSRIAELASLAIYNAQLFEQRQLEIVERQRAEEEAKQSQANWISVIESTGTPIWSVDKEMRLIAYNQPFVEDFKARYPFPPSRGLTLEERLTPELLDRWRKFYARALAGERFTVEQSFTLPNSIRLREYAFSPIVTDGEVTGAVVFTKDITDQQRSAATLGAILDHVPEAIIFLDREAHILAFNRQAQESAQTENSPTLEVGRSMYDYMPSHEKQNFRELFAEVMRGKKSQAERRVEHPGHPAIWFEAAYTPVVTASGEVLGMCLSRLDITERKRTEEELRSSRASLLAIIESTHDVIWSVNHDLSLQTFNSRYRDLMIELYGPTPKVGQSVTERMPPDRAEFWRAAYTRVLQGESFTFERQLVGRILDYSLTPIVTDDKITGVVVFAKDITKRKLAEEELKTSQARLLAVVESTNEPISAVDKEYRVITFNSHWAKEYEATYHKPATSGIPLSERLPLEKIELWQALYARAFSGERFSIEQPALVGDKEYLREYSLNPIISDGEITGVVVFVKDVTDRKRQEEILRDSELRFRAIAEATTIPLIINVLGSGQTLYGNEALSKMLGLPLSKIIGTEATQYYAKPDERRKVVAKIRAEGEVKDYELQLRRYDGTPLWVSISSKTITFETQQCVLTGFYDLTERKQAETALRHSSERLATLYEISRAMSALHEAEEVLEIIYQQVQRCMPVDAFNVSLYNRKTQIVSYPLVYDMGQRWHQDPVPLFSESILRRVLEDRETLLVNRTPAEIAERQRLAEEHNYSLVGDRTRVSASFIYVPLIFNDTVLGTLAVHSYQVNLYTPDHVELLKGVANQAAIALENARLYATVQQELEERRRAEKVIQEALREKEVLLKEVHHRVKNNMQVIVSLINLQSNYIEDPTTLDIFRETQGRVRSMALVHEKLYQSENLAQIDFMDYIEHLASSLFHSYSPHTSRIKMNFEITATSLGVDTAIPCGLIVNELVSNSLKYAFPNNREGTITIYFHKRQHDLLLSVADDGLGFPAELDFRQTESLGMQLVISLTKQLGGTIALERAVGTKFNIQFPLKEG